MSVRRDGSIWRFFAAMGIAPGALLLVALHYWLLRRLVRGLWAAWGRGGATHGIKDCWLRAVDWSGISRSCTSGLRERLASGDCAHENVACQNYIPN